LVAVGVIDFIAAIFVLFGGLVAFRPKLLLHLGARTLHRRTSGTVLTPDQESVFRMIGIMVMAFSFTLGAYSTLIFLFSRSSSLR